MIEQIHDRASWEGGPLYEVYLHFHGCDPGRVDLTGLRGLLDLLGIDGPYPSISAIKRKERIGQWPYGEIALGTWNLRGGTVGVHIDIYPPDFLYLGIPPAHMEEWCGTFPWNTRGPWANDAVVAMHHALLRCIGALHGSYPLDRAFIMEEGWGMPPDGPGVYLHAEVAMEVFGCCETQDCYVRVEFEQLRKLLSSDI